MASDSAAAATAVRARREESRVMRTNYNGNTRLNSRAATRRGHILNCRITRMERITRIVAGLFVSFAPFGSFVFRST